MVLAIPLGVWLGHLHRGSFIAINVSNVGRALPSLAVISIGLGLLGVGFLNVMVALVILAAPVMLTNAYVAVDQVDKDAVQAARAMGMRPRQVLLGVATEGFFALLQYLVTPRGLRKRGEEPLLEPAITPATNQ